MIPREAVLPGLLTLVGLFCAVKAVLSYVTDPRPLLGTMIPVVLVGAATAAVFLFLWHQVDTAVRTHRFSIDAGGAPKAAIKHEVAHAQVAKKYGGRVIAGQVNADGSGYVDVRLPHSAPLEYHVAVSMAGAIGEGENFWTSPHAAGDRANSAEMVSHLPPDERRKVYNAAAQGARPGFLYSGSCSDLKTALTKTGRYR